MTLFTRFIFIAFISVLCAEVCAGSTKVYVWRNDNGILVYSDSPKPGAEEVAIDTPNTLKSSIDISILEVTPKTAETNYEVEITQPVNNATVRDNTGSVHVSGRIKPIFKKGFTITLSLDGKSNLKPQPHSVFVLRNVDRGEHQLQMNLLDEKGKVIASSPTSTFFMHRASVTKAN